MAEMQLGEDCEIVPAVEMTPKRENNKKKPTPAGKAKAPQAPPKSPKPEPKPTPHAGASGGGGATGDAPPPRRFEDGSASPDNNFMARNDIDDSLLGVIQAKMDQSNGIDKGACAWCLLGPNGPQDRRVGLQGSCGRAHMGPADRKPQFCIAACTTAGLNGPLYLNNKKFKRHLCLVTRPPRRSRRQKKRRRHEGHAGAVGGGGRRRRRRSLTRFAVGEWRKQRTPFLDSEAEEIGRGGAQSDGARRAFGAAAGQGDASMASQW